MGDLIMPPVPTLSYAKITKTLTKVVECQTDCTWLTRDNPVVCATVSQTDLVGRKLQVQKPTQTEPLTSSTKPTKQAVQAQKRTTPTDRIKKAEKPTIPVKNRYQTLNDVETDAGNCRLT